MTPLLALFKAQKQLGSSLLEKLMTFLGAISLPENLERMVATFSENEQEKHEQVWRTFTSILEQFQTILGKKNYLWMISSSFKRHVGCPVPCGAGKC